MSDESSNSSSYDKQCDKERDNAEERLINHFKLHGGEVWNLTSGCQKCRTKVSDGKSMQVCAQCRTALFCNRECQVSGWKDHKRDCKVISSFLSADETALEDTNAVVEEILASLGRDTDTKPATEVATQVATMLDIDISVGTPGWFCNESFEKKCNSALFDKLVKLYALMRNKESRKRDSDSFPRSAYTYCKKIPDDSPNRSVIDHLLAMNGHLFILTAWFQNPQTPAIQSTPFEDRGVYGILDSILQISEIHDAVDNFMDRKSDSSFLSQLGVKMTNN